MNTLLGCQIYTNLKCARTFADFFVSFVRDLTGLPDCEVAKVPAASTAEVGSLFDSLGVARVKGI